MPKVSWRYIDIPRTGSTSFRELFGPGADAGVRHTPYRPGHESATQFVTIIRHPLDRLVSIYAYVKKVQPNHLDGATSFAEWVKDGIPYNGVRLSSWNGDHADAARKKQGPWLTVPQWYWIEKVPTGMLRILRFENLDHDAEEFNRWLGRANNRFPHINQYPHPPWRELYADPEVLRIATAVYAIDLVNFQYEVPCGIGDCQGDMLLKHK